jgi:hypothetical protein
MVHNPQKYEVSGLCSSSGILNNYKNTTFRKLDLFPSSGEGGGGDTSITGFSFRNGIFLVI